MDLNILKLLNILEIIQNKIKKQIYIKWNAPIIMVIL